MLENLEIKINNQMLSIISEIDEFKGSWKLLGKMAPEKLRALKKVATIESVGSSNRIEGNKLSDKQVEELLSRIQKQSFANRDEEEVAGYAKLADTIFEDWEIIPLSENYIKQLHKILLEYSSKDEKHKGEYKKISNAVAAYDSDGKEIGVVFETATPFETPIKMQELVHKYNTEWALDIPAFDFDMDFDTPEEKEQAKEAYIRAFYEREAKFHIEFERIHPFEDGNGRTGRIITNAHLLHNNLAPIIITSSMKNIYLNCISNRDHQTLGNLFRMLASVTTSQLIAYYRKVKGISPDDIGGKRGKPNK